VKVVLLHALPFDERAWDDVRQRLDHQVVAPTLYALGDTIEEWARGCLAQCGSDPIVVVGNSVGGSCAIEIAKLAPQQVRHLVLIGAKAGHRPEPALRDEAIEVLRLRGVMRAWTQYWEPLIGPGASDETRKRLVQFAQEQQVEDLVRGLSVFHSRPDRSSYLAAWPGPVTVVAGEHDIATARASATAAVLQNGHFKLLAGTGHYGPIEAPEAVAEVVNEAFHED
jgi:pimeloyl-ACP methyl ester carboxylesterase